MHFNIHSVLYACCSAVALANTADRRNMRNYHVGGILNTDSMIRRNVREWKEMYENELVNFKDTLYLNYNEVTGTTDYVADGEVVLSADGTKVAARGTNNAGDNFYAIYKADSDRNRWSYHFPIEQTNGRKIPGTSISLSRDGRGIAVGGLNCSTNIEINTGVICYDFDNQRGPNFDNSDVGDDGGDSFGTSVSLNHDSSVLAVGSSRGRVYVYIAQTVILTGKLNTARIGNFINVGSPGNFGELVKVVGSKATPTVFVGGRGDKIAAFKYSESTGWRKLGNDIQADGTTFEPADNGEVVAVRLSESVVRVYQYVNRSDGSTEWVRQGQDLQAEEGKLASLSISNNGNVVAVGSYHGDKKVGGRPGSVSLYEYVGDTWREYSLVLEDTRKEGIADFGRGVSLSGDGSVIAVSAPAFSSVADKTQGYVAIFESSDPFPSGAPSRVPSTAPSRRTTSSPTRSIRPSSKPVTLPSLMPSEPPTNFPTKSMKPSLSPSISNAPTPYPSPLPTPSTCLHDCECKQGSFCDLSECKYNCNCPGGFCDMQKCEFDCRCEGGNCNMNTCEGNCQCEMRGCQMDNCIYNSRCVSISGSRSNKSTSFVIIIWVLILTMAALFV